MYKNIYQNPNFNYKIITLVYLKTYYANIFGIKDDINNTKYIQLNNDNKKQTLHIH